MSDSKNTLTTSDAEFEKDVLQSPQLALVDFWAEWCGPCKMLGPTIDQIAGDFQGKIKVFKMDVDSNPATPGKYHIRGIPTVLLFKGGHLVDQMVGNQPKDVLVQAVQRHLAG